jgi:hypothetical protein
VGRRRTWMVIQLENLRHECGWRAKTFLGRPRVAAALGLLNTYQVAARGRWIADRKSDRSQRWIPVRSGLALLAAILRRAYRYFSSLRH